MSENIRLLVQRYSIRCIREDLRIEYILTDREIGNDISFALVLTLNTFARQIHVCKFYPGLYRQSDSRYLSAACFFLLIQHFAGQFGLDGGYRIFLQCRAEVFADFYARLRDFSFRVIRERQGENIDIRSRYQPLPLDTSMIRCPSRSSAKGTAMDLLLPSSGGRQGIGVAASVVS